MNPEDTHQIITSVFAPTSALKRLPVFVLSTPAYVDVTKDTQRLLAI
jgi:hypothetical protein